MIKKQKFSKLGVVVASVALMGASVFVVAAPVAAEQQDKPGSASCTTDNGQKGTWVSIAINGKHCIASGNSVEQSGITRLLVGILQFLAVGVGIAVVGGIVWGGILYMTARDNAKQTQQAIYIIINAIVGLLLFFGMYAIVNYLVPGGILR